MMDCELKELEERHTFRGEIRALIMRQGNGIDCTIFRYALPHSRPHQEPFQPHDCVAVPRADVPLLSIPIEPRI